MALVVYTGPDSSADASSSPASAYAGVGDGSAAKPISYVGLSNQGATCYLNGLLQTLFMTPEFRRAIFAWSYDKDKDGAEQHCIPLQLQRLFGLLQLSKQRAVDTVALTKSFGWEGYEVFQQQDVQELTRVLFDALEQTFKGTEFENIIDELYAGELVDYIKCIDVDYKSERKDKFLDFSLAIIPFGSEVAMKSLHECIETFLKPEILDGDNKYYAEKFDKKVDAIKGLKFGKLPTIMSVQLKRFVYDFSGPNIVQKKLNESVKFPMILDMNRYVASTDGSGSEGEFESFLQEQIQKILHHDSDKKAADDTCTDTEKNAAADPGVPLPPLIDEPISTTGNYAATTEKNVITVSSPPPSPLPPLTNTNDDDNYTAGVPSADPTEGPPACEASPATPKKKNGLTVAIDEGDDWLPDLIDMSGNVATDYEDADLAAAIAASVEEANKTAAAQAEKEFEERKKAADEAALKAVKAVAAVAAAEAADNLEAGLAATSPTVSSTGGRSDGEDGVVYESLTVDEVAQLVSTRGQWVYELYAVLVHSGAISGGHYYAHIKDLDSQQWFTFNDSNVSKIDEAVVREAWGGAVSYGGTGSYGTGTGSYGGGGYAVYGTGTGSSSSTLSRANAYMLMYRKVSVKPVVVTAAADTAVDGEATKDDSLGKDACGTTKDTSVAVNTVTTDSCLFRLAGVTFPGEELVPEYIRASALAEEEKKLAKQKEEEELRNRLTVRVNYKGNEHSVRVTRYSSLKELLTACWNQLNLYADVHPEKAAEEVALAKAERAAAKAAAESAAGDDNVTLTAEYKDGTVIHNNENNENNSLESVSTVMYDVGLDDLSGSSSSSSSTAAAATSTCTAVALRQPDTADDEGSPVTEAHSPVPIIFHEPEFELFRLRNWNYGLKVAAEAYNTATQGEQSLAILSISEYKSYTLETKLPEEEWEVYHVDGISVQLEEFDACTLSFKAARIVRLPKGSTIGDLRATIAKWVSYDSDHIRLMKMFTFGVTEARIEVYIDDSKRLKEDCQLYDNCKLFFEEAQTTQAEDEVAEALAREAAVKAQKDAFDATAQATAAARATEGFAPVAATAAPPVSPASTASPAVVSSSAPTVTTHNYATGNAAAVAASAKAAKDSLAFRTFLNIRNRMEIRINKPPSLKADMKYIADARWKLQDLRKALADTLGLDVSFLRIFRPNSARGMELRDGNLTLAGHGIYNGCAVDLDIGKVTPPGFLLIKFSIYTPSDYKPGAIELPELTEEDPAEMAASIAAADAKNGTAKAASTAATTATATTLPSSTTHCSSVSEAVSASLARNGYQCGMVADATAGEGAGWSAVAGLDPEWSEEADTAWQSANMPTRDSAAAAAAATRAEEEQALAEEAAGRAAVGTGVRITVANACTTSTGGEEACSSSTNDDDINNTQSTSELQETSSNEGVAGDNFDEHDDFDEGDTENDHCMAAHVVVATAVPVDEPRAEALLTDDNAGEKRSCSTILSVSSSSAVVAAEPVLPTAAVTATTPSGITYADYVDFDDDTLEMDPLLLDLTQTTTSATASPPKGMGAHSFAATKSSLASALQTPPRHSKVPHLHLPGSTPEDYDEEVAGTGGTATLKLPGSLSKKMEHLDLAVPHDQMSSQDIADVYKQFRDEPHPSVSNMEHPLASVIKQGASGASSEVWRSKRAAEAARVAASKRLNGPYPEFTAGSSSSCSNFPGAGTAVPFNFYRSRDDSDVMNASSTPHHAKKLHFESDTVSTVAVTTTSSTSCSSSSTSPAPNGSSSSSSSSSSNDGVAEPKEASDDIEPSAFGQLTVKNSGYTTCYTPLAFPELTEEEAAKMTSEERAMRATEMYVQATTTIDEVRVHVRDQLVRLGKLPTGASPQCVRLREKMGTNPGRILRDGKSFAEHQVHLFDSKQFCCELMEDCKDEVLPIDEPGSVMLVTQRFNRSTWSLGEKREAFFKGSSTIRDIARALALYYDIPLDSLRAIVVPRDTEFHLSTLHMQQPPRNYGRPWFDPYKEVKVLRYSSHSLRVQDGDLLIVQNSQEPLMELSPADIKSIQLVEAASKSASSSYYSGSYGGGYYDGGSTSYATQKNFYSSLGASMKPIGGGVGSSGSRGGGGVKIKTHADRLKDEEEAAKEKEKDKDSATNSESNSTSASACNSSTNIAALTSADDREFQKSGGVALFDDMID